MSKNQSTNLSKCGLNLKRLQGREEVKVKVKVFTGLAEILSFFANLDHSG